MIKKHSFTLLPFVRAVKGSEGKLQAIYLRITVDGGRTEISTKRADRSQQLESVKGRINGTTQDARLLNGTIQSFEHRAREVYNRCIESGKLVTADLIKDEVLGRHTKAKLLSTISTSTSQIWWRKRSSTTHPAP